MYLKKTLFLSLFFMNLFPANVSQAAPSNGKTALWGTVALGTSFYIADKLRLGFIKDTQKMKRLEKTLRWGGISLKNETEYGFLSIFSLTTFSGYNSTLNRHYKEIREHQRLHQNKLNRLSIAPLIVYLGLVGSSNLFKEMRTAFA